MVAQGIGTVCLDPNDRLVECWNTGTWVLEFRIHLLHLATNVDNWRQECVNVISQSRQSNAYLIINPRPHLLLRPPRPHLGGRHPLTRLPLIEIELHNKDKQEVRDVLNLTMPDFTDLGHILTFPGPRAYPRGVDGMRAPHQPWRFWGTRGPHARGTKAHRSPIPLRPKNGF